MATAIKTRMTADEFANAALVLLNDLEQDYPGLTYDLRKYIIHMPTL